MLKVLWRYIGILIVILTMAVSLWPLSYPLFKTPYSTIISDVNGRLLSGKIADDGQWRFPTGDSIPKNFVTALLHFEDEYFFYHPGINPVSLFRAAKQNFKAGKVMSGGSTLTMQVARLINSNKERTLFNKIYEMTLAIRLEVYHSKAEILSLYAAHAPFGGNVVGLEAAAWRYYGRQPHQLSWSEAATLAVLPNSPSLIYPGKRQELLRAKRDGLLKKLNRNKVIDDRTLQLTLSEPLPDKPNNLPDLANHLLTRVLVNGNKGEKIVSTLDVHLQYEVQKKVQKHYQELRKNEIHNAAALIVEVKTGNIVAYVGNTNAPLIHSPFVDIIGSPRSTGSILKPLLYAAAIDKGHITPHQLIPDIPTFFHGFTPKNFDNNYHGAVAASEALTKSFNIPFVYLLRDYSYEQFHKDLQDLGMSTLNNVSAHYGLSLILGGAEATLFDLASIYAGLARTLNNYYSLGMNSAYQQEVLYKAKFINGYNQSKEANFLSAGAIWWMFKGMQELQRPEDMSGWYKFAASRKIAWKTGTSYGFRDAWAVGTDGDYVVAVWTGNADGEGRPGLTGVGASAPLMFDIFDLLPAKEDFLKSPPAEMEAYPICAKSGYKAGVNCAELFYSSLPEGDAILPSCPYHILVHLDEDQGFQVNADCYTASKIQTVPWFTLPPVQAWYYKRNNSNYEKLPSFAEGCIDTSVDNKVMEMIYPRHSTKVYIPIEIDGKPGNCVLEAAHVDTKATIYWHLDNQYLGRTKGTHQLSINPVTGQHHLRLVDEEGNEINQTLEVLNQTKTQI